MFMWWEERRTFDASMFFFRAEQTCLNNFPIFQFWTPANQSDVFLFCRRTRGSWQTSRPCARQTPSSSSRICGPSAAPWWRTAAWWPCTLWASERSAPSRPSSWRWSEVPVVTLGWAASLKDQLAGCITESCVVFFHCFPHNTSRCDQTFPWSFF